MLFTTRNCRVGENYSAEGTCEKCPANSYTFIPQTAPNNEGCPPCPLNAVCENPGELFPAEGHVRLHKDSQIFIACLNFDAC